MGGLGNIVLGGTILDVPAATGGGACPVAGSVLVVVVVGAGGGGGGCGLELTA